jgi:hypothetical protein
MHSEVIECQYLVGGVDGLIHDAAIIVIIIPVITTSASTRGKQERKQQ